MIWLMLTVILDLGLASSQQISLNNLERQYVLNFHNYLRATVATGYQESQTIANMNAMSWSRNMEEKSQNKQTDCQSSTLISHSSDIKFLLINITRNNKDLVKISETVEYTSKLLDEFVFNNCTGALCHNLLEMMDPQVYSVGCSIRRCMTYQDILICAYNHKYLYNTIFKLLTHGEPCSACSTARPHCLGAALCTSTAQCAKSRFQDCDVCSDKLFYCLSLEAECSAESDRGRFIRRNCRATCLQYKPNFELHINVDSGPELVEILSTSDLDNFYFIRSNTQGLPCEDNNWMCQNWAAEGHCDLEMVGQSCQRSCDRCDRAIISHFYQMAVWQQSDTGCSDKRIECNEWARKNYCYIKSVQLHCPRVCAICPEPQNPIKFQCKEESYRATICSKVKARNLCFAPDMKTICPLTCGNIQCGTLLPTTTLSMNCLSEPESHRKPCSDFLLAGFCHQLEIQKYCPSTCRRDKCGPTLYSTTAKSTKSPVSSTDSPFCSNMKHSCSNKKVQQLCRNTCSKGSTESSFIMTSTTPASTISVSASTETPTCLQMLDICNNPAVMKICKQTCKNFGKLDISTSTTISTLPKFKIHSSSRIPTTMSTMSTITTTEDKFCWKLKSQCNLSIVRDRCKETCKKSFTPATTTQSSSISSTFHPNTIEPPYCKKMKIFCDKPGIRLLCYETCTKSSTKHYSTTSTSSTRESTISSVPIPKSVEPQYCKKMKGYCNKPDVFELCKETCKESSTKHSSTTLTSTTRESTISSTLISKSVEPATCKKIKALCNNSGVRSLCKETCANFNKISTRKSSTSSTISTLTPTQKPVSTSATTTKQVVSKDPERCVSLVNLCVNTWVKNFCKITCRDLTTTEKPLTTIEIVKRKILEEKKEAIQCIHMPNLCINPKFKKLCWKTCAEYERCELLKSNCNLPSVRSKCKKTCEA